MDDKVATGLFSPSNKRRTSNVIKRRSSIGIVQAGILKSDDGCEGSIKRFKKEISEWDSMYQVRRKVFKEENQKYLSNKKDNPLLTMESAKEYLSETDRLFFSEAPDFAKISRDMEHTVQNVSMLIQSEGRAETLQKFNQMLTQLISHHTMEKVCTFANCDEDWIPTTIS